jgi:nicotinamide-nucleotide amidase
MPGPIPAEKKLAVGANPNSAVDSEFTVPLQAPLHLPLFLVMNGPLLLFENAPASGELFAFISLLRKHATRRGTGRLGWSARCFHLPRPLRLLAFLAALLIGLAGAPAARGAPAGHPTAAGGPALDYMLVVTGEELLRGAYPDAHTCFITRTLHFLGGHCLGSLLVDDRSGDIQEALRFATAKARLVIVTGGLGPTVNDVTRDALSEFTGIPLQEDPAVCADLARRFNQPFAQLRANLRRQALVPTRGSYLRNPNGTAVGLVFEGSSNVVVALPGPPRELQAMVTSELVPYLRGKFGARSPGSALTVRFVGIGQSQIDQALREHVPLPPDVVVGSVFEASRVDFMFGLPGDTAQDRARLAAIEAGLRARLGEYIYADDGASLEEVVAGLFRKAGGSLALVECGSRGHLAAALDQVTNLSQLLAAAWVAPTGEQMRGILGVPPGAWSAWRTESERIEGLGRTASALVHSQWVVVVGEITRDTSGATGVWLGFGGPKRVWQTQWLRVQGAGETAHASLATQVLDRLRKALATPEAK